MILVPVTTTLFVLMETFTCLADFREDIGKNSPEALLDNIGKVYRSCPETSNQFLKQQTKKQSGSIYLLKWGFYKLWVANH